MPNVFDKVRGTDFEPIVSEVLAKYEVGQDNDSVVVRIVGRLRLFAEAVGAFGNNFALDRTKIRGLKVLDLACGTDFYSDLGRKAEPWFCRTLCHLGVGVTGVDIKYPKSAVNGVEDWRFVQMDLTRPKDLQRHFRDRTFNVVHSNAFLEMVGIPESRARQLSSMDKVSYERLVLSLLKETRRMLKAGGKAVINDKVYKRGDLC